MTLSIGSHPLSLLEIFATVILLAGVIDDLRTKKFHNWLFISCTVVGFAAVAANGGINGMLIGVFGFLAGLAIFLPMVLGKIVGAGDMKLMAAFGIVAGWQAVIGSAFWALVWGAVFGVARVIFSGQGRILFSNLKAIVTLKKRQELVLHRMPFTFAILMGWLSYEVAPGVFQ
jgi:prepilin peptidase CpaA